MTFIVPDRRLPGDLILSDDWNKIRDALNDLNTRLAWLESLLPGADGHTAIWDVTPSDVHISDPLTITGVNFGVPGEMTAIFDGSVSVTSFQAADDRTIMLLVPALTLPTAGRMVTVQVNNTTHGMSNAKSIFIRQAVQTQLGGTMNILPPVWPAGNPQLVAGKDWVITIPIDANMTLDETYNLTPTPIPGWTIKMVTDLSGATDLVPSQVRIAKPSSGFTRVNTFMKFNAPLGTTGPATLGLSVTSVNFPTATWVMQTAPPGPMTFTVGTSPVSQTITSSMVQGTQNFCTWVDAQTVSVSAAQLSANPLHQIDIVTNSLPADTYTVTLSNVTNSQWWVSLASPAVVSPLPAATTTKTVSPGGTGTLQFTLSFVATNSAAPTGTFDVTINGSAGSSQTGKRTFTIRRV